MKIYFAASAALLQQQTSVYKKIISLLRKNGHKILDSWIIERLKKPTAPPFSSKELLLKQLNLIQDCEVMVVEVSTRSFGVGYLIGQALAEHKPILCLYPQEKGLEDLSTLIKGTTSSLITLRRYTEDSLDEVITDYFENIKLDRLHKFNFLASKEVLDFIEEGAKKENKSKSEFLRDKISRELLHNSE